MGFFLEKKHTQALSLLTKAFHVLPIVKEKEYFLLTYFGTDKCHKTKIYYLIVAL